MYNVHCIHVYILYLLLHEFHVLSEPRPHLVVSCDDDIMQQHHHASWGRGQYWSRFHVRRDASFCSRFRTGRTKLLRVFLCRQSDGEGESGVLVVLEGECLCMWGGGRVEEEEGGESCGAAAAGQRHLVLVLPVDQQRRQNWPERERARERRQSNRFLNRSR